MIDDLRPMAIFAAVAEAGSFTAAAKKLRLTTSVVSHHVSKLEERLDVALLYRSTRSLSITDEGRKLLVATQAMLLAAESGLEQLGDGSRELSGTLRLTMPAFMFSSAYEQAIWRFAAKHPNVVIDLHSSDRQIDLIEGGFDVAIRLSELTSSALKVRRLGSFERKLVCAPSYLEAHGPIDTLDDLRKCDFVEVDMVPGELVLERNGEIVELNPRPARLRVNSIMGAHSAVLTGLAVQRLPASHVEEDLRLGRLVELLPDWSLPKLGIFAVWPQTRSGNLSRRFIEFLGSYTQD